MPATPSRAQITVEHLLGRDADTGAEREEIEEEMLHEALPFIRAGRAIRPAQGKRQRE